MRLFALFPKDCPWVPRTLLTQVTAPRRATFLFCLRSSARNHSVYILASVPAALPAAIADSLMWAASAEELLDSVAYPIEIPRPKAFYGATCLVGIIRASCTLTLAGWAKE